MTRKLSNPEPMNMCEVCRIKKHLEDGIKTSSNKVDPKITHFEIVDDFQDSKNFNSQFSKKYGIPIDILEDKQIIQKNAKNDKSFFSVNQIHDDKVSISIPPTHEIKEIHPMNSLCYTCYLNMLQQLCEEQSFNYNYELILNETKDKLLKNPKRNYDDDFGSSEKEKKKIAKLKKKLEEIESKCEESENELNYLLNESNELKKKEEEYWIAFTKYKNLISERDQEQESFNYEINFHEKLHSELKNFSALKIFRIRSNLNEVTICGFRLGFYNVNNINEIKDEINAALSMCALLLIQISIEKKITFSRYEFRPLGSKTYLIDKEKGNTIQFYFSHLRSLSEFNMGMKAFHDCTNELLTHPLIKNDFKNLSYYYFFELEYINGKYNINEWFENFTKPMLYLLGRIRILFMRNGVN